MPPHSRVDQQGVPRAKGLQSFSSPGTALSSLLRIPAVFATSRASPGFCVFGARPLRRLVPRFSHLSAPFSGFWRARRDCGAG